MLTYEWKDITIGSDFNAVLHAFEAENYLLFNNDITLHSFDRTTDQIDLGGVSHEAGSLVEDVLAEMSYTHSLKGLCPLGDKVSKLRFDVDDHTLAIITKSGRLIKAAFQNATLFDLENIEGLPDGFQEETTGYRVFDWFDVKSGMLHGHDLLEDNQSDFVKRIRFFISSRIDGNKDKKDLVAESFLTKDEINNSNYSDTIARLKTIEMMEGVGITGTKNGNNILPIKLELWKRDVLPVKKSNYIKFDNITYMRKENDFK